VSESSPRQKVDQGRPRWTPADLLSAARIPLAAAFPLASNRWRMVILAVAAATDLLDGPLARRFGPSAFGSLIDPVADKLFMASAFGVVAVSGRLTPYEIAGVLLRDIAATVAFLATVMSRRPRSIPARAGGKAVTVAQGLTLVAFVTGSRLLQPLAWATAALAVYAIWDYYRVAPLAERAVGSQEG
jgi:phosphatidylglycerophosphate synthase